MVMKWAVAQGWRQDNPAAEIAQALPKRDTSKRKHRRSLHHSEVANCLQAVQASRAGISTKLAFEFLVLTATRSGEVRNAVWSEIEFNDPSLGAVWKLPASRMKAKRPHSIPLSARAISLLKELPSPSDGTELVFPGTKPGKPISDMTLLKLVRDLGFETDIHGFRTSFRTWAQERTNVPREVAEAALAHTIQNQAEAAYARSDLFERRRGLMEAWSRYVCLDQTQVTKIG